MTIPFFSFMLSVILHFSISSSFFVHLRLYLLLFSFFIRQFPRLLLALQSRSLKKREKYYYNRPFPVCVCVCVCALLVAVSSMCLSYIVFHGLDTAFLAETYFYGHSSKERRPVLSHRRPRISKCHKNQ